MSRLAIAALAFAWFLANGHAEAATSASDLLEKTECPVALAHYKGGFGAEDHAGIIVAVWRDGTIVRAERRDRPWEKHVVGRVDAKDMPALTAILARGDIWYVARGEVGPDLPEVWLVLQQGNRRWAWWESPGFTRTRELQDTISKLWRFHIEAKADLIGSFERSWQCMNGQLEHGDATEHGTAGR
jgi:hypothetical protein